MRIVLAQKLALEHTEVRAAMRAPKALPLMVIFATCIPAILKHGDMVIADVPGLTVIS
jgi:hypothetical protein